MRVPSFHAFRAGRAGVVVADPKLWSWGGNGYGELGLGNTTNRSSPVQVGALTDWTGAKISSRVASTLAVKSNGTLWAWGSPLNGVLGLGDATNRSSPVQVGTLTNWAEVSVGRENVLAVKTDGTLWSWGINYQGQLGQGNTTNRSSPVQVGTLTNWSEIAGGGGRYVSGNPWGYYFYIYGFFSSIKTDGTLWSWGINHAGQLGLGNTTNRSSPVQVGALTTWSKLSINSHMKYRRNHNTAVIKTDGTLWAWGSNLTGAFANGTSGYRSSPVQVLSGTSGWDWVSVISSNNYGNSSSIIAIRTS